MKCDLDKNGEISEEELKTCLNAKNVETGQDMYTEEQKIKTQEHFKKADINNDGKVDITEAIKYKFQNGKGSISQKDLTILYGEEKTKELMKFDKDGDGKLNAKEFDEATKTQGEKKGFLDGINFKDPKVILTIIGIALTVIGVVVGLCVWLSRRNKKKKEEQAKAEVNNKMKSGSVNMSVSTGNSAEKVRAPITTETQNCINNTFGQYGQSNINNQQQPLSLNDSRKSTEISR